MRGYGKVAPQFWTGETGRAIRGQGTEAQLLALYLMTCPASNMIGLYYLPMPTMAHETGLGNEGASEALRRLNLVQFSFYAPDLEVIWVPEMAHYQIGEVIKPKDKKRPGVVRELETYKKTPFYDEFVRRYNAPFRLGLKPQTEAPSEPPARSMTVSPQDQDQDQEQEQEQNRVPAKCDTKRVQTTWCNAAAITQVDPSSLRECVVCPCEQAAAGVSPPVDPNAYAERAIATFAGYRLSKEERYQPHFTPQNFKLKFDHIQRLMSGAEKLPTKGAVDRTEENRRIGHALSAAHRARIGVDEE